ncbi:bacillithiol biosynthesis BshC [Gemmatimonas sp.]|uniref:bacillithiol biosynthesis protein BshC n=1 Tax=Gemmatimonas sp. TaxID=1962908 RepID=UPI003568376F
MSVDGVIVRTAQLGGSTLSQAVQRGEVGAEWYAHRPASPSAWRAHALQVQASHDGFDWLTTLAPAFAATGAAADRLAQAAARGVVVTTGQQPGLFGGPSYTWTKAISALSLADELSAAINMPVAPVFWAASDDADWMEAAVTHVATVRGLQTMSLVGEPTEGVAMADVPLGDLTAARATLAAACGSAARASVLDAVDAAYVPHATVGAAYVQLLRALLEPLGIAVLDAAHPAFRVASDRFLRHALSAAASVSEALSARTQAIVAAGYAPQVDVVDGLSLVFQTALVSKAESVQRVRVRVPMADAATVAREAAVGTLGANVLLRPVLERSLLPTLTYLAGPGELAYFAQVAPIASALGAPAPVVSPRWAGEVLDGDAYRALDRLGLAEATLRDPHAAEQQLAQRLLHDGISDTLERLRVAIDAQLRALRDSVDGAGAPVTHDVIAGLSRDLTHRIDKFEHRVLGGVKRNEVEAMRELAYVRASLRPMGKSPERVLNLLPYLARFGVELLTRLREASLSHARALVHGTRADS